MKCKITRQEKKRELKEIRLFFKELEKLNPKRNFCFEEHEIKVDTLEVWRLNLPEDCKVRKGKDKKDIERAACHCLVVERAGIVFYIYGW